MKTRIYLVLNRRGVDRITKVRKPELSGGEIAVALTVEVDDSHFVNPVAEAYLAIEERQMIVPDVTVEAEDVESDD